MVPPFLVDITPRYYTSLSLKPFKGIQYCQGSLVGTRKRKCQPFHTQKRKRQVSAYCGFTTIAKVFRGQCSMIQWSSLVQRFLGLDIVGIPSRTSLFLFHKWWKRSWRIMAFNILDFSWGQLLDLFRQIVRNHGWHWWCYYSPVQVMFRARRLVSYQRYELGNLLTQYLCKLSERHG